MSHPVHGPDHLASQKSSVRQAVRDMPNYPFKPITVRCKLDQNECPYDFPAELKAKATELMLARPWNRYPDLMADTLREAIARYEDWDPQGVVVTSGSNVLIKLLTELAGLDQTVLTVEPTFPVYLMEAKLLEAKLVTVPLNPDFSLPIAALQAALHQEQPGLLYITQPHAPSGHLDEHSQVIALAKEAEALGWLVVLDEAYYLYADSDYRELVRESQHCLSLRTFSKTWGLAGIRAGYVLAPVELAQQLQKLVSGFSMSIVSQCVLEVALAHPEYMKPYIEEVKRERVRIIEALKDHPTCTAYPTQANFFLWRTPDAQRAYQHLLSHGIVTRSQDNLPGLKGCLRIGLGSPAENDQLIAAMGSFR